MKKMHFGLVIGAGMTALVWVGGANAQTVASAEPTLVGQILAGRPLLEVRARFERYDQARTATLRNAAEGTTVRTRFGWETGEYRGFKALVDFDNVSRVGPEHFAITKPGLPFPMNGADKAKYPAINDPNVTELNRAQLTWTPNKAVQIIAGRQKIQLDDQRFIAAAAWRQDEMTYDSVRTDLSLGKFKGTYVYVDKVNRSLGQEADWDSDSHFFNVGWTFSDELKVQGFVYALDFEQSKVNTSITKGVRATGKTVVGPYKVAYNSTFARQTDWRGATEPYELDFFGADIGATRDIYSLKVGYDTMEGNGSRGFGAPLSAAHAFNGWADAWSSTGGNKTFAEGLDDLYVAVTVKPKFKSRWFSNPEFIVRHHDFESGRTGKDLAEEWDLQLTGAVTQKVTAQLKYADFERVASVPVGTLAPPASRHKLWFTLEYKL